MSTGKRSVFFVSDRTGITAETLGHSLMTQFDVLSEQITLPFVDSPARADMAVAQINEATQANGARSIVFSTVIDDGVRETVRKADAVVFDFFETFIAPLETELEQMSSHMVGKSHGVTDSGRYDVRIDAMNFSLNHDDGATTSHYSHADVILIGVSRSGKTPACLYLALQYGIYAANYPLTEEDLAVARLPKCLDLHRDKLYGLSIDPDRLQQIRNERRPNSKYASPRQCQFEVAKAEAFFRREKVPFINTTNVSIEEIASTIMHERRLKRRLT